MDFSHQRTRNLDGRSTEVTSVATGALADRVRRRLGAPADTEVHLTEWHVVSGTDWTVEFETTLEVTAGDKSVVFVPDDANADDWSVGLGRPEGVRDTVYARFDAWLRAADDPAGLIADWFDPHETCDWWESWTVRPGTPLHAVAVRLGGGPRAVERVSLARIPERGRRTTSTGRSSARRTGLPGGSTRSRPRARTVPCDHPSPALRCRRVRRVRGYGQPERAVGDHRRADAREHAMTTTHVHDWDDPTIPAPERTGPSACRCGQSVWLTAPAPGRVVRARHPRGHRGCRGAFHRRRRRPDAGVGAPALTPCMWWV